MWTQSFRNKRGGEKNTFLGEKTNHFTTKRSSLKEIAKDLLPAKGNDPKNKKEY